MAADLIAAIFLIAIVYVLVRPSSAAVAAVDAVAAAMAAIVSTVTDL